jgi:hypothetical protein
MPDANNQPTEALHAADDSLAAQLLSPATFPHFVSDSKALVATEIKKKGLALRTAFNVAQKIKPDIVERAVRELMPQFVHEIEPCYADYRAGGGTNDFRGYLLAHDTQVADAMLKVADRRAELIHSQTILTAYKRVRSRAQREIIKAMPGIAATIGKYSQ